MRTTIIILVSILVVVTIALVALFGSLTIPDAMDKQDKLDRRFASYSSKDKQPLGGYVSYTAMQQLFKDVKPSTITRPFSRTYRNNKDMQQAGSIYFIVAGKLFTSQQDVQAMYDYASIGNRLFVAVEETDSLFDDRFVFTEKRPSTIFYDPRKKEISQSFVNSAFAPDTLFSGKGIPMVNYLDAAETEATTILGNNAAGQPNFFRIKVGKGYVFVMLNPMVWTNYFLLQNNNIKALETQMAYLPQYPQRIYWDEYYKTLVARPDGEFSNWQVLLRHPALRWALWLAVILLILYVLFEGKRRQRLIPEKPLLSNASLDFVETLGKLYYLHHNNRNLAQKMSQHLLEYIRNHYYLNTSNLSDEFVTSLSRKSGHAHDEVTALVAQLKYLREADHVDDHQLQHYYNSIYQFYLKAS